MLHHFWSRIVANPIATFLVAFGIAVIAAQLSALVVVARGQVERAQLREAHVGVGVRAGASIASCLAGRNVSIDACEDSIAAGLGR